MTIAETMHALHERGVRLTAAGDRLRFHPADAVDGDLLDALRTHKAAILAAMADPSACRVLTAVDGRIVSIYSADTEPEHLITDHPDWVVLGTGKDWLFILQWNEAVRRHLTPAKRRDDPPADIGARRGRRKRSDKGRTARNDRVPTWFD